MISCIGALIFLLLVMLAYFTVLYLSATFEFLGVALPFMLAAIWIAGALLVIFILIAIIKEVRK